MTAECTFFSLSLGTVTIFLKMHSLRFFFFCFGVAYIMCTGTENPLRANFPMVHIGSLDVVPGPSSCNSVWGESPLRCPHTHICWALGFHPCPSYLEKPEKPKLKLPLLAKILGQKPFLASFTFLGSYNPFSFVLALPYYLVRYSIILIFLKYFIQHFSLFSSGRLAQCAESSGILKRKQKWKSMK